MRLRFGVVNLSRTWHIWNPKFIPHMLQGFLVNTRLAMICMPTLKWLCTEILNTKAQRYTLPRRRVVDEVQDCGIPERGDARLVITLCELPRFVLSGYLAVSRHHNKPIRGGTSSGCIDRIDNSILNLYLARTQQHGWQCQDRQRLDEQCTDASNRLPILYSQHPGCICCI